MKFTNSGYKDINALFIESLDNNRYHLHMYARREEVHQKLKDHAKKTSDPNFLSFELNKTNHLFVLPPYNNVTYQVDPINQKEEFFEKIIEFKTGVRQTIMDVLLMLDAEKHKFSYIVCNREKTFIAFNEGTDAIEMMNRLKKEGITAHYATCYAHLVYLDDDVPMPEVQNNRNRDNNRNNERNRGNARNNRRTNRGRGRATLFDRNRNKFNRVNKSRGGQFNRNNNANRTKFIRVEVPSHVNQHQYEIRLVRK